MIGEVEEFEIGESGKKYMIKKVGVSIQLEIQSIYYELISGLSLNDDTEDSGAMIKMITALRGPIVKDVKRIIIECVKSPRLNDKTYEEKLKPMDIIELINCIFKYNISDSEDKKKGGSKQNEDSKEQN